MAVLLVFLFFTDPVSWLFAGFVGWAVMYLADLLSGEKLVFGRWRFVRGHGFPFFVLAVICGLLSLALAVVAVLCWIWSRRGKAPESPGGGS